MQRDNAALHQSGADQKKAVTMERIFFRTHHHHILAFYEAEQAIHTFQKVRRFAARRVIHEPIGAVIPGIEGAAAELVAEELINDFCRSELRHQGFTIELREAKTAGPAAYIANHMDFVPNESTEKVG